MATVYDLITDRILEKLQQGTVPWQKPWHSISGLPRNLLGQKPYRGINVWVLGSVGYTSPHRLTFKQAKEIGGHTPRCPAGKRRNSVSSDCVPRAAVAAPWRFSAPYGG